MSVNMASIPFVYEGINSKCGLWVHVSTLNTGGIIFEGTSKTVFHFLYGICVSVYDRVDNSELLIIICCNSQSPVVSL